MSRPTLDAGHLGHFTLNSSISQNSTEIAGRSHSADDLAEFISGFVTVSSVIAPRFLRLLNLLGAQEH